MLVTTRKISLDSYSDIQGNNYSKGSYCFYVGDKGQSLEQIIDNLVPKGNRNQWLFVFENYQEKRIYIIFIHSIMDTITVDLDDGAFTWEKLNSIIITLMISHKCDNVLALEGSRFYKEKKIKVPLSPVSEEQFIKVKKKTKNMAVPMAYALRYLVFIGIIGMGIIGQSYLFEYLETNNTKTFISEKNKVTSEKNRVKASVKKINEQINEYPTALAQSYEEVLSNGGNNAQ